MTITLDTIEGAHLRNLMHLDGQDKNGRWFADMQQMVEYPRLSRMVKQWRKRTKKPEEVWSVDGDPVGSIEAALDKLNATPLPPVSITELALLDQIANDWQPTPVAPIHMQSLRDKGLVELNPEQRGQVRRTALAREVLAADRGAP